MTAPSDAQDVADSSMQVYFVTSCGLTKVGYSKNLKRRVCGLRDGSAAPVELVHSTPGGRQLEQAIHDQLAERRHHGEWFDGELTKEECEQLAAHCRDRGGLTSKTAREVLKSEVWADGEEIADPTVDDDDARAAWNRGMATLDAFSRVASADHHHALVESLKASLKASAALRLERQEELNRPGGIDPVPPPTH